MRYEVKPQIVIVVVLIPQVHFLSTFYPLLLYSVLKSGLKHDSILYSLVN